MLVPFSKELLAQQIEKLQIFLDSFEVDLDQISAADFIQSSYIDFITRFCVVKTDVIQSSLFFRYRVITSLVELN